MDDAFANIPKSLNFIGLLNKLYNYLSSIFSIYFRSFTYNFKLTKTIYIMLLNDKIFLRTKTNLRTKFFIRQEYIVMRFLSCHP